MLQSVFVDSDVCLDVLTGRMPFATSSNRFFDLIYKEELLGAVSSLSIVNIHYILRKDVDNATARQSLIKLKTLVKTLDVTNQIIEQALVSTMADFEDAVQFHCALKFGASCIITRNIKDYKKSSLPVHTPEDYLKNFT